MLEQNIPGQKIFVVIWRLSFEYLHRIIALKSRIVYSGNEGTEGRVIVQSTKLVGDIDKFLNLPRSIFGFVMAQDQRDNPTKALGVDDVCIRHLPIRKMV